MTTITQLLEKWEARSRDALPSDAMLINKHIRELREAVAQRREPEILITDGDTAKLVGQLCEVAREFHTAQQLRERIAQLVRPWAKGAKS